MNVLKKQNRNCPHITPLPPPTPLLLSLHPHLLLFFTMPCFLINFCGVWNPLGAISHFSKHPGSFWGSGARRRRSRGRGGPHISISIECRLRGDLSMESRAAERTVRRRGERMSSGRISGGKRTVGYKRSLNIIYCFQFNIF